MASRALSSSLAWELWLSGASELGTARKGGEIPQPTVSMVLCVLTVSGTFSSLVFCILAVLNVLPCLGGVWLYPSEVLADVGNWNWNSGLLLLSTNSGSRRLFFCSGFWVLWTTSEAVELESYDWSSSSIRAISMSSFLWMGILSKARTSALQSKARKHG